MSEKSSDSFEAATVCTWYSKYLFVEKDVIVSYNFTKTKPKYYFHGSEIKHKVLVVTFNEGKTAISIDLRLEVPCECEKHLFDYYFLTRRIEPPSTLNEKYAICVQGTCWEPNDTLSEWKELNGKFSLLEYILWFSLRDFPVYQGTILNCADWVYSFTEFMGGNPKRSNERINIINGIYASFTNYTHS